jgi:SagB-type dehydrogenase family enzyme
MADYLLNSQVVFRSKSAGGARADICVGEGTNRRLVSSGDPALVSWLLGLTEPMAVAAICDSAAEAFSLNSAAAVRLVDFLRDNDVLLSASDVELDEETTRLRARWERWGWRDALDFHLAVRNCSFSEGDESGWEEQDTRMADYQREVQQGLDEPSPGPYKLYPEAPTVALSRGDELVSQLTFRDALHGRRTTRDFGATPVPFAVLSELLQHSLAVTHETQHPILGTQVLRTSPSGGARHPTEAYVVVLNVEAIAPGVYHYNTRDHSLELLKEGMFGGEVVALSHRQARLDRAGAVMFFSTRWARHQWKYRYARSYRMVMFDVAHLVQTHLLVASALRLQTFLTPAIRDRETSAFLQLPNDLEESPLYLTAVGMRP